MPKIEADDMEKLIAEAKGEGGGAPAPAVVDLDDEDDVVPTDTDQATPAWAKVPAGFSFPPGWTIWFVRFRAPMTNMPKGEDRTCILWNLSESDEKRASKLARGDGIRIIDEMAKAMIRSVDGKKISLAPTHPADGDGFASVAAFWNEIGGKCRQQLKGIYLKTHVMDASENADFFEHCVAPRTVG